jgi:hypothetical protein
VQSDADVFQQHRPNSDLPNLLTREASSICQHDEHSRLGEIATINS